MHVHSLHCDGAVKDRRAHEVLEVGSQSKVTGGVLSRSPEPPYGSGSSEERKNDELLWCISAGANSIKRKRARGTRKRGLVEARRSTHR